MTKENEVDSGFVAGTLVHTKEGLMPIEQIKVGDFVLSKPDRGAGELAYKRVSRMLVCGDQEIFIVRFYKDAANPEGYITETLGVTANHPFWVKNSNWTCAHNLDNLNGHMVELHDGSEANVICSEPLHKTRSEKVGWIRDAWGVKRNDFAAFKVELRQDAIIVDREEVPVNWELVTGTAEDYRRYKDRAFNLEVEDFHTYYVGELGVWVAQRCRDTLRI